MSNIRRAIERLSRLRESASWSSIATSEHLATSMKTLTAEIEQGLKEHAGNYTMQKLAAETVVVAIELSARFGGNLGPAVEEEIRRREAFAFASDEIKIAEPSITAERLPSVPRSDRFGSIHSAAPWNR